MRTFGITIRSSRLVPLIRAVPLVFLLVSALASRSVSAQTKNPKPRVHLAAFRAFNSSSGAPPAAGKPGPAPVSPKKQSKKQRENQNQEERKHRKLQALIRSRVAETLRLRGFTVVPAPNLRPPDTTARVPGSAGFVFAGFYVKNPRTLTLHGQIYDSKTGYLLDAFTIRDEIADLSGDIPELKTHAISHRELVDRFARRATLRMLSNPRRRERPSALDEFIAATSLGRAKQFPRRKSRTAAADVFRILGEKETTTATRTPLKLRETPAVVRVITSADIREHGYRYLHEVLRDQPGFDMIYFQGLYGSIFMQRGLDQPENLRTLIFIDGVLDNNISQGNAYIKHKYSLHDIKRIEILYGPASSLYGANAFSGVINLITRDGGDIKNNLEYGVGSVYYRAPLKRAAPNAYFNLGRRFGEGKNAVSLLLSGHWIDTRGPVLNKRDNIDPKKSTYFGTDGYSGSALDNNYVAALKAVWRWFTFGARQSRDFTGNSTFATGAAYADDAGLAFWNTLNTTVYGKFAAKIGSRFHERLRISYRETTVVDGTDADFSTFGDFTSPLTITRYRRPDSEISLDNPFQINWSRDSNTIIGINYANQYAWNYNTRSFTYDSAFHALVLPFPAQFSDPNNKFRYINRAIYLQHYWRFTAASSMTLGYRHDVFRITGADGPSFCGTNEQNLPDGSANPFFLSTAAASAQGCVLNDKKQYYSHFPADKNYRSSNPRVGLVHTPDKRYSAKLLYGQAFRAPTVRELYSISSSRITNAELEPETIRTLEAGLIIRPTPRFRIESSLFHNYVRDIIFLADSGIHRPGRSAGSNLSRFQNAGKAQVSGTDITLEAKAATHWKFYFTYTYQRARIFDVNDPSLLAHEGNDTSKIQGVTVCRTLLEANGLSLLRERCGGYHGDMPRVARHKFNVGSNLRLAKHLNIDLRGNFVGRRPNIATNPRQDAAPYFLVNLTIGVRDWPLPGMDIDFKVFNLFDSDILDPGFRNGRGDFFPSAHPQPNRYVSWEIKHRL